MYITLVVALRVMGKRQIAQLQPYELVLTIAISDLASVPMAEEAVPLFRGILSILALIIVNTVISIVCLKSERVRGWVCGKPSTIIRNGRIDMGELRKLTFTLTDLAEQVRAGGVASITDVDTAVLETGGGLSVFPVAKKRPQCPEDIGLDPPRDTVPLTLVLDGRTQQKNLALLGCDERWLAKTLARAGVKDGTQALVYAVLGIDGTLTAQERQSDLPIRRLEQAYKGAVVW